MSFVNVSGITNSRMSILGHISLHGRPKRINLCASQSGIMCWCITGNSLVDDFETRTIEWLWNVLNHIRHDEAVIVVMLIALDILFLFEKKTDIKKKVDPKGEGMLCS